MDISIHLTEEQLKALLTQHQSIESYAQAVSENRANRLIDDIVTAHADGKVKIDELTPEEDAILQTSLDSKIVVHPHSLSKEIKSLIVRKARLKTAVEKIAEQSEELA